MSVYDTISSIYEEIFPVNRIAVEMIESLIPHRAEKRLLDLGAATGGYARAFADRGWDTLGIELNREMALVAASKAHVVEGSMLKAEAIVRTDYGIVVKFGAVLCLGNTLPHITPASIPAFFTMIRHLLFPGAPFILQTLNYSHPDVKPGFTFPAIEAAGFKFDRHYETGEEPGTFSFVTTLADRSRSSTDSTVLYALKPEMISYLLRGAGFKTIETWSGWDRLPFDPARDLYVVTVAR
ncbi:MAG TPA: class I SAM-dependent methyltransferase [Rectinemataceae bacterium]|nr:class I SAM-dependent methyltransferase [Rectinemataceae bacterium]